MATTIAPQKEHDETHHAETSAQARISEMKRNPGLYIGAALGLAPAVMPDGMLLATTLGTTGIAAGWAALGVLPGPWRWLPGHGQPWEWMCRSSRRGYRRTLRRMRRRLTQTGAEAIAAGIPAGWYGHPQRPALIREVTADARRARCEMLRSAWAKTLPNWDTGWWRKHTPAEMILRAGPLAVLPAAGFIAMPWWAHLGIGSLAATWGVRTLRRPAPAVMPEPEIAAADWYQARWAEWIACERGPLPESRLVNVQVNADELTAVIVSTTARPAASLGQDPVSIAFDVPPRAVNIYQPVDMPANRAKITVRLRAAATSGPDMDDLAAVWDEFNPYNGSKLYDVEKTEFGNRFQLLMPRRGSGVADVQAGIIAQALDLQGEGAASRLHLRVLDSRRIEVNEMSINPLQDGVPLDLDALLMDDQGYITVGKDIYGLPTRWRLLKYDPARRGLSGRSSASAVHAFGSGTTGAGKTSLEEDLQVAQRRNGFVSWLADGKGGAGYAPWMNDLDWLVKSPYGAMLMGQGANRVSEYRYAEQMKMQWLDAEGFTENGRSFFVPGEPFAPMAVTWDEFNEMVLKDPQADHVKPLLRSVSSVGRLSRAAGIGARIWVQIPNLDSLGSDASANAIRDMLQSGNIALFRTARADVDVMSLGSRTPKYRLEPLPERFPDGSETGGVFYMADGKDQYTQSRAAFHTNPARLSRQFPLETLTDREAEAAGPAYLRRDEYRHLDAADEEEFLRELSKEQQSKSSKKITVIDTNRSAPTAEADDEDLDDLVPLTRTQKVWHAVDAGARRNKQISEVTDLKPANVAGATTRLERLGKLRKVERDWHTTERLDA
ncbi:hypothetical protein ADK52_25525 [Streptomyces sp. WM6372]|uniref:hypothetical protein n=1 Tax=Streptomyces sp. WM6372 TaxID=1415555 RepID=UPI0006ADD021|nr:hypothetical protein [Streptomyces sp. WM6372]KOU20950.1 hypothetical protein ADK52_25525 [Streptomyces sp. WM6372]